MVQLPNGAVTLRPANLSQRLNRKIETRPASIILAFNAEDRADVRKCTIFLKAIGAKTLDPPAEYASFPGYFAVYFADPDGLKCEFAFVPRP